MIIARAPIEPIATRIRLLRAFDRYATLRNYYQRPRLELLYFLDEIVDTKLTEDRWHLDVTIRDGNTRSARHGRIKSDAHKRNEFVRPRPAEVTIARLSQDLCCTMSRA